MLVCLLTEAKLELDVLAIAFELLVIPADAETRAELDGDKTELLLLDIVSELVAVGGGGKDGGRAGGGGGGNVGGCKLVIFILETAKSFGCVAFTEAHSPLFPDVMVDFVGGVLVTVSLLAILDSFWSVLFRLRVEGGEIVVIVVI